MLRTYNLPWILKAYIILQNVYAHHYMTSSSTPDVSEATCQQSLMRVFEACTGLVFLSIGPAAFVSVPSRRQTLEFQCHVLAHMTVQAGLLILLHRRVIACEHVCYMIQFCSCYIFYFIYREVRSRTTLVVFSPLMYLSSFVGMILIPLCFSKAWTSDMHVNKFVLIIIFSGEACGVLAYCMHAAIEHVAAFGAKLNLYHM